ncbi:MAG: type II secretion system protein M [Proteobacteria bacterium]|nr:type II secretion system protein M [Pseudomonadota bacterium]MBU1650273.1 type II secretion system protein M [Pseudomonadota bacterium]
MTALTVKNTIQTVLGKTGLNKLENREKRVVLAGVLFLVCFALFHFAVSPLIQARQQTQKSLIQKNKDIKKIHQLQEEYRKFQAQAVDIQNRLYKRSPSFTLFAFIEEQATKAKVKQQINSMTPSTSEGEGLLQESRVDLKFERISLQQLVDFLQQIESTDNVVLIKRISIQENSKEEGALDAVMQIITFTQKS